MSSGTPIARRQVLRGGALAAPLLLAACGATGGAGDGPAPAVKQPVKLAYLLHNATKREVDERHVPEYKEKNPHVDVEFSIIPDAELTAKITSLFAAGSGPEIYNPSNGPSTAFIDRGWAAEVDYRAIGLRSAQGLVDAYAWPTALDGW